MTNEQAKQEAIKKAYGDKYDLVSDGLYGSWYMLKLNETPSTFGFKDNEVQKSSSGGFRPISLTGIHDNNGWIRIEPDGSNLPAENDIKYKVIQEGEILDVRLSFQSIRKAFEQNYISHYKPIEPELKPIY